MKYLEELKNQELKGKKVLLRVDFNIPVVDSDKLGETFRIQAHRETLDFLTNSGAKVALVSHIDPPLNSFSLLVEQIGAVLGQTLTLAPYSEVSSVDLLFKECTVLLIDNIRQDLREEKNDLTFASELANSFDYYINDAFSVCHRNHASVSAITKYLPSYAGFLIKKEVENLSKAMTAPAKGKVLVLGGAKISTKLPVVKNFLDKAEKILIGGALANNFFKAQGINVGASLVDDSVLSNCLTSDVQQLPEDVLVSRDKTGKAKPESYPIKDLDPEQVIVDIGPKTAELFAEIIKKSATAIWNGPMGLSEVEKFAEGTKIIAQAVAEAEKSVIGGGDTIAAVEKLDLLGKFSYISTGGGAMLAFLAGEELPGLRALGYYQSQPNQ